MMPILVKSDDVRRGRKAKVCHVQLKVAQASIECVRCHAIKSKIKKYATDKVKKL